MNAEDFLTGYIMALISSGEITLGPDVLDQVVASVYRHGKAALAKIAKMGAVQGVRHYGAKGAELIGDPVAGAALNHYAGKLADLIDKEGFGGLWNRAKKVATPKRNPNKPRSGLDHLIRK